MANEKLLLRKGSLQNLHSVPKIPGAISITTDVPGIYYDVNTTTRIRLGDFVSVATLADLSKLAQEGNLNETVLYYVQDQNVLAKYSATATENADGSKSPGLIWINDTSSLDSRIATLERQIGGIGDNASALSKLQEIIDGNAPSANKYTDSNTVYSNIEAIKGSIGQSDDTTDTTVYGKINKEVANLSERINDIIGGTDGDSTGSISGLQEQIDDLKDADSELGKRIQVIEDKKIEQNAEYNKIISIKRNNTTLSIAQDRSVNINVIDQIKVNGTALTETSDHSVDISIPTKLSQLTDDKGFSDDISSNTALITRVYGADSIPENTANGLKTIVENATAIANLKGNESGYTSATVSGNAKRIAEINGDIASYTGSTINGNAKAISDLKGKSTDNAQSGTVLGNQNAIASLTSSITNITTPTTGIIDTRVAAGVQSAKDYADTQLNTKITQLNSMTFKGPASSGKWWSGTVYAGDTYVVSSEFTYTYSDVTYTCHLGDLLVAAVDQDPTNKYDATVILPPSAGSSTDDIWYHIQTGYVDAQEPTLGLVADANGGNKIQLTSHAGSNQGQIEFSSQHFLQTDEAGLTTEFNGNLTITKTATGFEFGLAWVDF